MEGPQLQATVSLALMESGGISLLNPSKHPATSSHSLGAGCCAGATVHPLMEDTQRALSSAPTQSAGASLFQEEELPASFYPCLSQGRADRQDNVIYLLFTSIK